MSILKLLFSDVMKDTERFFEVNEELNEYYLLKKMGGIIDFTKDEYITNLEQEKFLLQKKYLFKPKIKLIAEKGRKNDRAR